MIRLFHPENKWTAFFVKETQPLFDQHLWHYQLEVDDVPRFPETDLLVIPDYYIDEQVKQFIPYLDKGFKCILEKVWEDRLSIRIADRFVPDLLQPYVENSRALLGARSKLDKIKTIDVLHWFWIHEYGWMKHHDFVGRGSNNINDKLFLMPMLKSKPIRKYMWDKTEQYRDNSYISLVEKGHYLEGEYGLTKTRDCQRKMNTDWYDRTVFSIAVESYPEEDIHSDLFVTEKTYKPLAYQHPFMTLNKPGSLAWIKEQGFETYDNIFDESYDDIEDMYERADKILDNIHHFEYDDLTIQKMEHNSNHFYNEDLIHQFIKAEIIEPLWEFLS